MCEDQSKIASTQAHVCNESWQNMTESLIAFDICMQIQTDTDVYAQQLITWIFKLFLLVI